MYSTCLYCHGSLGQNTRIEAFPVGERLAFDAARGRLWAVCPACARWNLSPLEERWEAVEECERLFRDTALRTSTDNIGLARPAGGPVLVRIGQPMRPEFAAWRYAPQLVLRRRRDLMHAALAAASPVAMLGTSAAAIIVLGTVGAPLAAAAPLLYVGGAVAWSRAGLARVVGRTDDGAAIRVRHLRDVRLHGSHDDLEVTVESDAGRAELSGPAARMLAAVACARSNQIGARPRYVRDAVDRLERGGGPGAVLDAACRTGELRAIRYVDRIALEMALHEEQERGALHGELAALEAAWRDAEEIAGIADRLALGEGR